MQKVSPHHDDNADEQIGEDEVAEEDEDHCEPLAVRPFV